MSYQLGVEINDVIRGLQLLTAQMKKDVNNDLKGPADLLASAIKARTPVSSKSHSRYRRKGKKGTRARKGSGVIVATYRPGNLQKSFRSLSKLRRIRLGVMVGPLLGGKRIDGYYAHFVNNGVTMTNGKTRAGKRFVEAAIAAAGPVAALGAKYMMKDGVIDPKKGPVVSGEFGTVQLNPKDQIAAGTNLMGSKSKAAPAQTISQAVSSNDNTHGEIKQMREENKSLLTALLNKTGDVYMDTNKVGRSQVLGSYKSA